MDEARLCDRVALNAKRKYIVYRHTTANYQQHLNKPILAVKQQKCMHLLQDLNAVKASRRCVFIW